MHMTKFKVIKKKLTISAEMLHRLARLMLILNIINMKYMDKVT